MFEMNEDYTPLVEAAIGLIESFGVGVDIPTERFEQLWGCARYSDKWHALASRLRKLVKRRLDTVWYSMKPHTMRALTKDDLRGPYQRKQFIKRWRSTSRSKFALDNSESPDMSAHEMSVLAARKTQLANERRALRQAQNAIRRTLITQTNPVRPAALMGHIVTRH